MYRWKTACIHFPNKRTIIDFFWTILKIEYSNYNAYPNSQNKSLPRPLVETLFSSSFHCLSIWNTAGLEGQSIDALGCDAPRKWEKTSKVVGEINKFITSNDGPRGAFNLP